MNGKSLLSAFLTAIIISGLTLAGTVHFSTVHAATEVTGVISADTTWTKANSPYMLTGPVGVAEDTILTIEAGVTINLDSYYIQVNGTLSARGSSTEKIYINNGSSGMDGRGYPIYPITFTPFSTDWNEQNETGCIIENAVLSATSLAINVSPKIYNNSFADSSIAISSSWSGSGAGFYDASPIISNNTFNGAGISTFYSGGLISNNIISGCSSGIDMHSDTSTIVEGNLIIDNSEGILLIVHQGPVSPTIRNNTITNNSNGISLSRQFTATISPVILHNNIFSNTNYNINSGVPDNVNATFNWWGTIDTQEINQTIRDYYEDYNLGEVDFVPFLSEQNPAAPTIPTFTVTASAGAGGTISPSGSVSVAYGEDQTFTVTPNSGYQIASVLMDGVPATAPYTFTNVVADGHTISATFELIPTSSPTPSPSPSPSPTPTPTQTPTPTSTQISISVDASSTAVGSAVNVNGRLSDSNGNSLNGKSVTLSYALTDSNSWVPVGSGTTNSAGEYSIQWVNTASGTFTLKAEWNGDDEYLGANATTTLSFLPYENQQYFFVESNSTVSALAFNSTSLELSFTVNGTSGTAGYVKVTIAKSLVANAENIKVYLDGNKLNYEVTSNADSWLLAFTYTHSTHQVTISLTTSEPGGTLLSNEVLILIAVVIVIAAAGAIGLIVWRKKKKG